MRNLATVMVGTRVYPGHSPRVMGMGGLDVGTWQNKGAGAEEGGTERPVKTCARDLPASTQGDWRSPGGTVGRCSDPEGG